MGLTIFLGAWAGKKLDEKYNPDKTTFTVILTLFSVGVAMFNLLRQVNRLNEQ